MFEMNTVLVVVASLVGVPALWSLLIEVLKYAGVVNDGTAGKWSAALNLITLLVVAAVTQFYPQVDVSRVDQQIVEVVKFCALIFGYMAQILTAKGAHALYVRAGVRRLLPPTGRRLRGDIGCRRE